METTEKKTYNNAPLADKEYFAKPRWHEVAVNEKSGNLTLTVLWDVCDKDGNPGNFDMETGALTPLPQGADSWEAVSSTYVLAFAEEAQTLKRCKGKDLEYLKDVCPKTYKHMSALLKWCPDWEFHRAMWFYDCKEAFYRNVVRVTVVHEEWKGVLRAKAKWTNSRDRQAKEVDTTEAREKIAAKFGGFFDLSESAPQPKKSAPPAAPTPAPASEFFPPDAPAASATKADAWAAFCKQFSAKETERWFEFVRSFKKKEADFTPTDWARLKQLILDTPPF